MAHNRLDSASGPYHGNRRRAVFLVTDGEPYFCKAGDSLLTVLPNGDLLPCRRMPIVAGNLYKKTLMELYYDSNLLALLRDRERVSLGCEKCRHAHTCRGGLKCLSYALYNDPFRADPGCPLADSSFSGGQPI